MSTLTRYFRELTGSIEDIRTSDIVTPPRVLRRRLGEVEEIADSIKKIGLLQPIIVRTLETHFEIVAGNRRYHACKRLGWRKIPCHVVELDDKSAFEVAIVENVQRNTLDPIEEGLAFKEYVSNIGWGGISELAQKLSKSLSYISRRIRLVELPQDILDLISDSQLSVTAAEELMTIKNKREQSDLAQIVKTKKFSSREVRQFIKEGKIQTSDTESVSIPYTKDNEERILRSFDKSIIALKVTAKKFGNIIEDAEQNWIIYDLLMQHKLMLNAQIDLLIKQKKKCKRRFLSQNLD
ncbi:MAG TPA: ParB/RepB/Spo0J family partition protein [Nitrososphaeraceae archaeon]